VTEMQTKPLLHDAQETRALLGNAVSVDWLKRKAGAGEIPCTRIGRFVRWSDADIERLIAENYCDPHNYGRKPKSRR